MKIGILTFHCAHNYGAVLQAYALQEYLKSCGHDVEVIDYRPSYLLRGYKAFPWPRLKGVSLTQKILRLGAWGLYLPQSVFAIPLRVIRRRGFENFISGKMNLSQTRFGKGSPVPAKKYDAILFGSDQIWSPIHTDGGDLVFLGAFPVSAGTLKVAYAASAGASSKTLGENPVFANALKNFDAISVREENLAESLQSKTDLKIETVLDPTLLVDKSVWEKIAETPKAESQPYVLVYQVSYNEKANQVANEIAAQIGAEVVSIWAGYVRKPKMRLFETPEEFVGWFKGAACVVSTSFHGTAFSLIFEKPFYYVGNGNAGENRPKQVLAQLGLMDRFITDLKTPKFSEINYGNLKTNGGGISRQMDLQSTGRMSKCDSMRSAIIPANSLPKHWQCEKQRYSVYARKHGAQYSQVSFREKLVEHNVQRAFLRLISSPKLAA